MKLISSVFWRITAIAAVLAISGTAAAKGGFVEVEPDFDGGSINLTNPWWPLPSGVIQVYLAIEDDECVVSVLEVMPFSGPHFNKTVDGVDVRTVRDSEYIDEAGECDGDLSERADWELLEITLDWYAQDTSENIWYMGEHTIALDEDDCEHETDGEDPILEEEGCLDGSWEAGFDIWADTPDPDILPGVIMLRDPMKGQFYFQEYWEDEATDMGKVLSFKSVDTLLYGELEDCVVIKEWVPLEPGNIEHKYYCEDIGLVLVEGNAGGKTVWTDLVYDSRQD